MLRPQNASCCGSRIPGASAVTLFLRFWKELLGCACLRVCACLQGVGREGECAERAPKGGSLGTFPGWAAGGARGGGGYTSNQWSPMQARFHSQPQAQHHCSPHCGCGHAMCMQPPAGRQRHRQTPAEQPCPHPRRALLPKGLSKGTSRAVPGPWEGRTSARKGVRCRTPRPSRTSAICGSQCIDFPEMGFRDKGSKSWGPSLTEM